MAVPTGSVDLQTYTDAEGITWTYNATPGVWRSAGGSTVSAATQASMMRLTANLMCRFCI